MAVERVIGKLAHYDGRTGKRLREDGEYAIAIVLSRRPIPAIYKCAPTLSRLLKEIKESPDAPLFMNADAASLDPDGLAWSDKEKKSCYELKALAPSEQEQVLAELNR